MLGRLWTLIKKELQAQFRDRDSRRLLIMPVVLQLAVIPFAATLEVINAHLAIYNQDAGAYSVELTQRLAKSSAFSHVQLLHGVDEVNEVVNNQHALMVVSFPSDFSRNIASGKTAILQTIGDGRRSNATQIAMSYIQDITDQYNLELAQQHYRKIPPSEVVVQNWFNPNLEYRWFILPCLIALITTVGCLVVTAMSVAREREQGTFEQLLVSPLSPALIMIGKVVPALVIATIQASIILLASIWLYQIPFQGSLILLYICILFYGLALAGVGLLISSICSTQQQAFLGVFCFIMPSLLLSGFISPVENIPQPLQAFTWLNPIRHFIVLSKGIYLKHFDFALVWHDLWPLIVIGIMTLSLAYVSFKRNLR